MRCSCTTSHILYLWNYFRHRYSVQAEEQPLVGVVGRVMFWTDAPFRRSSRIPFGAISALLCYVPPRPRVTPMC